MHVHPHVAIAVASVGAVGHGQDAVALQLNVRAAAVDDEFVAAGRIGEGAGHGNRGDFAVGQVEHQHLGVQPHAHQRKG